MIGKKKLFLLGIGALLVAALMVMGVIPFGETVSAQDGTSLLVNGSLERPYYGQGSATRTVPQGWSIWVGAGAPEAFPHTDSTQVLNGEVSWNVKQGFTAFTAAGYQTVSGLTKGDVLKLTAHGWVYTCNDTEYSCVIEQAPYRASDTSAGASLKVGIDPTGGVDPNSANVKWSAVAAPYDQWAEMSVVATAEGGSVTVFLYMTQSAGLAMNNVYWDNASLVRTEEGEEAAVAQYAPFVSPQGVRPDGSIVHVVQAGDTLSSIAYAYAQYGATIESIAALNEGIETNTRFLQLGQELTILAAGSVDPVTGQPVPAGSQISTSAVATPVATAATAVDNAAQPTETTPTEQAPAANYAAVQAIFMPFEQGAMIWLQDSNQIYVLANGDVELSGTYSAYQDTWRDGMPETDPTIQAPEGFMQPSRGFGQAWRTYPGVRDGLGWGTSEAAEYTALVVTDQGAIILNAPDGQVYSLLEGGNWQAADLYSEQ